MSAPRAASILALTLLAALTAPMGASGDAIFQPGPPDYKIEIVRGLPISLPLEGATDGNTFEVRFDVDGKQVQTDHFAPYGDFIPTKRFEQLGVALEVPHTLTATAIGAFDAETKLAEYSLLIHPMPVIRHVDALPLVFKGRTSLVGFRLQGIGRGSRVQVWGRGFRRTNGNRPLPLRLKRKTSSTRVYVVPGSLEWGRGSRPRLIFSVTPPEKKQKYGFSFKGRVFTVRLRARRNGTTGFTQDPRREYCTWGVSSGKRPPRRSSCLYPP
jgi:hypothetical protein